MKISSIDKISVSVNWLFNEGLCVNIVFMI